MRRIACAFVAALVLCLSAAGQEKTLRIAGFPLEPYVMENAAGGEATGAVIRYWKEYLGPRMGYKLEVSGPFPINRVEAMLKNGEIDVAVLFTKIPARDALFKYPEHPFAEVACGVSVLPNSPIKAITKPDDFFGMRIGYIEGAFVPPFFKDPRIAFDTIATGLDYREVGFNRLIAGRVDVLLEINMVSIQYYINTHGYRNRVRLMPVPIPETPVYSIFRRTPEGERLAREYDAVNAEGLREGVFERLLDSYLE
jgi:ABC-type amino acid transport substrate-binding protein